MLPLLVSIGFQILFHSPSGVLFTFPSRYYFTIGHQGVFSLGGWSPLLPTGFLVSRGTLDLQPVQYSFRLRDYHSLWWTFPGPSSKNITSFAESVTPYKYGLGCFPFARRYLGNRFFFLFLRVLRCFSSPGIPSTRLFNSTCDT